MLFNSTVRYIQSITKPIPSPLTYLFAFSQILAYTTKINFFPLHFNNFLEENLSKSPHFHSYSLWSYHHDTISANNTRCKMKSPWYISPLTSRTTVSPSCSNFKVLLLEYFLRLISKTNTLGVDLKLIGCTIAEKQQGHCSWVSCSKDQEIEQQELSKVETGQELNVMNFYLFHHHMWHLCFRTIPLCHMLHPFTLCLSIDLILIVITTSYAYSFRTQNSTGSMLTDLLLTYDFICSSAAWLRIMLPFRYWLVADYSTSSSFHILSSNWMVQYSLT